MAIRIVIALAVLAAAAAGAVPAAAQCAPSEGFTYSNAVTEGDLMTVLAAEHDTYALGDVVTFELIVTNVGQVAQTIAWPVTEPDVVFIMPTDCTDPFACDAWVRSTVPFLMYVPGEETLAPGECRSRTLTWDTEARPAPEGACIARGGLFAWWVDDPSQAHWITPEGGVPLPLTLTGTVPVADASWSAAKAAYR